VQARVADGADAGARVEAETAALPVRQPPARPFDDRHLRQMVVRSFSNDFAARPLNIVGDVVKKIASDRRLQARVDAAFPWKRVGRPTAPTQRSRETGWSMMPTTGRRK